MDLLHIQLNRGRHDSGMRDEFRKIPDECKASIKTEDEYKADLKSMD